MTTNYTEETAPVVEKVGKTGWRYAPHLIIFITSACIMIVEHVAGRLIARHLGSSLYTWTSIIAVILAGMSIGNFLGGRFADRWRSEALLGWLFMIASAMCLFTLFLNNVFAENAPEWITKMSWELRTIFSVFAIFLLPAMSLGTISPVTAKMALSRSDTVGATIGSVYAWGAVGSIVGTLAIGFLLIAWMGSKAVIMSVALGLAVVGTFLGPRRLIQAIDGGINASLLTEEKIASLIEKCGRGILTDDYAPVENLLAPVVRQRKG